MIENAWLGRALRTQVRKQPLIELIDGVQVTSLKQDTDFAILKPFVVRNNYSLLPNY